MVTIMESTTEEEKEEEEEREGEGKAKSRPFLPPSSSLVMRAIDNDSVMGEHTSYFRIILFTT
jgi:hypothetical protein